MGDGLAELIFTVEQADGRRRRFMVNVTRPQQSEVQLPVVSVFEGRAPEPPVVPVVADNYPVNISPGDRLRVQLPYGVDEWVTVVKLEREDAS